MYFEIYKQGNLIKRGAELLEPPTIDNELMYAPTTQLVLPVGWLEYFDGREEVKLFIGDKCYWGIVWDIEVNKEEESITLDLRHIISEWEYRQISVNHAMSNTALNIVYKGSETTVNESGDESITASGFTVSVEQAKKMTDADIIAKAYASAWVTSNGDNVPITSVRIQKCASASTNVLKSWYSAMETQFEWSINQDDYFVTPTVESSKKHGTCITFVAVSLQRIGLLPKGGYFYCHPTKRTITGSSAEYVLSHPNQFAVSYPKTKLSTMVEQGRLKKGDIVSFGNPAYHTMVYMGKNTHGEPIFNTMGSRKGLGITYPSHVNRNVDLLVRLTGEESDEEVPASCEDSKFDSAGTYTITFSTAKGTMTSAEVTVSDNSDPDYSSDVSDPSVVDKIEDTYNDKNFAYPGWNIDYQDGGDHMIDYVYSRQNKLDALTQTMELTDDLFWRVGLENEKRVQIGSFGEIKPYVISTKPSGKTNIRMITEPTIDYDFENVFNVATVYSDKSDGGMSSLTLRDVYNNPQYQRDGFPVVILHANVNNERDYTAYIDQPPSIAPNNELEYAVLDEESIALEGGTVIEGTYSYNDMAPFQTDGKKITDAKRLKSAKTVYDRTIRKLIQARRSYDIEVVCEPLPSDVWVGDRIRLLYDDLLYVFGECSNYWKKILSMDDYYYISHITYEFDENGNEYDTVTLTKWLKIERDTYND